MLFRSRLYPGKKEQLPVEGVTNDKFALVLRRKDTRFNIDRVQELLNDSGAREIHMKEAAL